jgi:hypothetical protein
MRNGISITSPASPENFEGDYRKNSKSFCFNREKFKVSSFLQVLNASCAYFAQKNKVYSNSMFQEDRVRVLEREREVMKMENSKLQLALARAKAKVLVYKGKVKSLKSYCKILEVNRMSRLSKDFFSDENSCEVLEDEKSSETEFQCFYEEEDN